MMSRQDEDFVMEDYGRKPAFASFLPGISGVRGIPIWCYYVNRGQCVASFGVENKDHAIMEFYPAHQAYQNVKTTGFRTFLRKDGAVTEAFADENVPHSMRIPMNGLAIEERNSLTGLTTRVSYFTLPGEKLGALARRVTVTNAGAGVRAFTPGWLENESVWLHMEYKYLLELLRSGLYEEFFRDFHKACIPFLDPEVYGRSIYENSSFIASSSNPDESCRGRGFVARLSGSTVEFISMWKLLLFGPHPFAVKDGALLFYPRPALPAYLIPEDGVVEARLLGTVPVTYRFEGAGDYIPGNYVVRSMVFTLENGSEAVTELPYVSGRLAEAVRDGLVRAVSIEIGLAARFGGEVKFLLTKSLIAV